MYVFFQDVDNSAVDKRVKICIVTADGDYSCF